MCARFRGASGRGASGRIASTPPLSTPTLGVITQVRYLKLLLHLNSRSFEEAQDEFHRYFDSVRASSRS